MTDAIKLHVDETLMRQIVLALKECAEDLDALLTERYWHAVHYPGEERRWKRDRAPVVDALYCLDRLREDRPELFEERTT